MCTNHGGTSPNMPNMAPKAFSTSSRNVADVTCNLEPHGQVELGDGNVGVVVLLPRRAHARAAALQVVRVAVLLLSPRGTALEQRKATLSADAQGNGLQHGFGLVP